MKEKIIFTNGLIDLAQPRLGTKVIYKLMISLHLPIELLVQLFPYSKMVYLINMENGWMDGSLEEKEPQDMITLF